jgi:hypothetical protein
MTLLWIGDAILIVVVLPVVVYLLNMTLGAARSIVPSVRDAAALLLTTRDQVSRTVAGVAEYGGSLDVILDDAEGGR